MSDVCHAKIAREHNEQEWKMDPRHAQCGGIGFEAGGEMSEKKTSKATNTVLSACSLMLFHAL